MAQRTTASDNWAEELMRSFGPLPDRAIHALRPIIQAAAAKALLAEQGPEQGMALPGASTQDDDFVYEAKGLTLVAGCSGERMPSAIIRSGPSSPIASRDVFD